MLDFLNLFRVESRKMFTIGWIIVLLLIAKGSLCYWNVMIIFGRSEYSQYFKYLFRDFLVSILISFVSFSSDVLM